MNPFLLFLIGAPLVFAFLFSLVLLFMMLDKGFKIDLALVVIMLFGFCGYLGFLLKKALSRKGAALKVAGQEHVPEKELRRAANLEILAAYVVLTIGGVSLFDYDLIKGWLGGLALVMGLVLLGSGLQVVRAPVPLAGTGEFQLARAAYPRKAKLFYLFAAGLALAVTVAYQYVPSWQVLSPWDLAGGLFLLASSCAWLAMSEHKRRLDG